jgi:hypothetical protein
MNGSGEVVLFEAPDGQIRLDVRLEQDTVWLTQAQMAELFGREHSVVTKHVRNVFREGELNEESNVQNLHIASSDKPVVLYNLDVIVSVGYRVKSKRGTQFRIWATRTLKDHLLRGYTLNDKRLRERGLGEIEQAVGLLGRTLTANAFVIHVQAGEFFSIIGPSGCGKSTLVRISLGCSGDRRDLTHNLTYT